MDSLLIENEMVKVDRDSNTPLYIQVYERLLKLITQTNNDNKVNFLPAERELAKYFDVDRLTVRKALSILKDDGLIRKRSGARTVITKVPLTKTVNTEFKNFLWLLPRGHDYLDRISEPFNAILFNHVERFISGEGYNLIYKSFSEEDEPEIILNTMDIHGIIFVSNVPDKIIEVAYAAGIPGVVVNTYNNNYPCVLGDRKNGVKQALTHLIELGHKEIAFIGGTPGYVNSELSLKGYRETLEKNGLSVKEELMRTGFWNFHGGYRAMQDILEKASTRPTAVFAADDAMAFGAHEAIRDAKLQIPKDISIVGFDNLDIPAYSSLRLTTVNLDLKAVAANTWWILKNQISGGKTMNTKTILPVELVIRESTAAVHKQEDS